MTSDYIWFVREGELMKAIKVSERTNGIPQQEYNIMSGKPCTCGICRKKYV